MLPTLLACAFALSPSPRFDAEGVPLPAEAVARVGSALWRHHGQLTTPVAAADGRFVYTAADPNEIIAWDADAGRPVHRFALPRIGPPDEVRRLGGQQLADRLKHYPGEGDRHLQLVADGRVQVIDRHWDDGSVRTLDPLSGRVLASASFHILRLRQADATRDGRWLAAHTSDEPANHHRPKTQFLHVHDLTKNAVAYAVPVVGNVYDFAFSPDDKLLAVADDETLRFLDAATGKAVRTVATGYWKRITHFWFRPDAAAIAVWVRLEAAPTRDRLEVWAVAGESTVATALEVDPQRWRRDTIFRPDGGQLAVRTDNNWQLVDAKTGKETATVTLPNTTRGTAATFAADGRRLFITGIGYSSEPNGWGTTFGGFLTPFDLTATPPAARHTPRPYPHLGTFTRNGDYVAVHRDEAIHWHVTNSRTTVTRLPVTIEGAYPQYAFSPDGERFAFVVPAADKRPASIEIVHLKTGRRTSFDPGKQWIGGLNFSPNGVLLTSTEEGVAEWPFAAGPAIVRPLPLTDQKEGWRGRHIFDGRWLWTEPMMPLIERPPPPTMPIRLYDLRNLKAPLWEFVPSAWGHMAAVSADGRRLVRTAYVDGGHAIELWDGPPARRRWQLRTDTSPRLISPDGRTLVGTTGNVLELIEMATGRVRHGFVGHRGAVGEVRPGSFSLDGRLLATASPDAPVYLWDVRGELQKPKSPPDLSAAWNDLASPDAAVAFQAIRRLAWFPERALPLLREKLPPVAAVDETTVTKRIAALDAPAFAERESAMKELKAFNDLAVPQLEAALKTTASAEVRTRIEKLLEANANLPHNGDSLRAVRAVEAVEWMGTPAARTLLQAWAGGAAGARLTREAKESLGRRR